MSRNCGEQAQKRGLSWRMAGKVNEGFGQVTFSELTLLNFTWVNSGWNENEATSTGKGDWEVS